MSVSYIPLKTRFRLWAASAGRCQYDGCNKILWEDSLTKAQFSTAYVAHIIADQPKGPRGNKKLSKKLKSEFSNLMLLCDEHHRLIDKEDVKGHTVEILTRMKSKHENRIQLQTALDENKQSHILHYGANIGELGGKLTWKQSKKAMLPDWYPAEVNPISLGIKDIALRDNDPLFWKVEQLHLQKQFRNRVSNRLQDDIEHLSIFAIAPIPLLIELGRLLSDVSGRETYQHQKEPEDSWCWEGKESLEPFEFIIHRPERILSKVALNMSLSAQITNDRITKVMSDDVSIWTITISKPNNDFMKYRDQLSKYRVKIRQLLDNIKAFHGQLNQLHVFPAIPVSCAVEFGRVWMPKADLPLIIYDQNYKKRGFALALEINSDKENCCE